MPFDGSLFDASTLRTASRSSISRFIRSFIHHPDEIASMTTMMLQDADLLIDDPDRWVQGHYSTKDERRCAMGALLRAYYETRRYPGAARAFIRAKKYLHDAVAEYGYRHVEAFNDNMPYEAVRCVFADAISRSRQ